MGKNYAYTDLASIGALVLRIGETEYAVSQYNASFALNEVPQAQCLLAIGRDAQSRGAATPAPIHGSNSYTQMTPATVTFAPVGEYRPDGTPWPEAPAVIFRGYLAGLAHRKVRGKFMVVANLIHWLADLGCSSCLVRNAHVVNPGQLNVAAVLGRIGTEAGAASGAYTSVLAVDQGIAGLIPTDVWAAIKTLFCAMASVPAMPLAPGNACAGEGDPAVNDRALLALEKFEGDAAACPFVPPPGEDATYSVPLQVLQLESDIIVQSLTVAIANQTIDTYASASFWDKLVGEFCPMFGLAVVPMVDRALVIADVPAYNARSWKTIGPDEYDSLDMNASLERPLRGVGVVAMYGTDTRAGMTQGVKAPPGTDPGTAPPATFPIVGGCYLDDSVSPGDGLIMVVPAPPWINVVRTAPSYPGATTGLEADAPGRAAGADNVGMAGKTPPTGTFADNASSLCSRYARTVHINSMLRGRMGALSGKLRFDIAPGSAVEIVARPEAFLAAGPFDAGGDPFAAASDDLAITLYGCVHRVTVTINAEAGMATTSLALTHIRTATENQRPRTSVAEHPLFGAAIHGGGKHGSPLVPRYDL